VLGILASAFDIAFLANLGVNWLSAIQGLFFTSLGFIASKYRSRVAIGLGMALFTLDGLVTVYSAIANGNMPIGGLIMKAVLIRALWQGMQAAIAYHREPSR
jgi:membrane carboxypeptidase/penicillin-binding protein